MEGRRGVAMASLYHWVFGFALLDGLASLLRISEVVRFF